MRRIDCVSKTQKQKRFCPAEMMKPIFKNGGRKRPSILVGRKCQHNSIIKASTHFRSFKPNSSSSLFIYYSIVWNQVRELYVIFGRADRFRAFLLKLL